MNKNPSYITKIMTRGIQQLRRFQFTHRYIDLIIWDADISELVKWSSIAFIFKILSLPIGLAISLIISRRYGADAMWLYGLMTTIVGICTSIGMLWLWAAMPRLLWQARAERSNKEADIYRTSFRLIILSWLILSWGLYFCSDWIALGIFNEPRLIFPLQVAALFLIPMMIQSLNISFLIASKHIYHAELLGKAVSPVIMLAIVFGSYWIWPTYYIPIWARMITAWLGMIVSLYILWRYNYVAIRGKLYKWKEMLKISGPMLVTGMAFIIVTHTDILMLWSMTNTQDLGIYKLASQLALLVWVLMPIISTILGPQLSEKIRSKKNEKIQQLLNISNKISSITAIIITGLYLLFWNHILSIFGTEFVAGSMVLIILSIYQCINVVTWYGGIILNYGWYEKLYLCILVSCSALNIILNYVLIQNYGMAWAALSTAISFNIANILVMYSVYKKTGLKSYFTF